MDFGKKRDEKPKYDFSPLFSSENHKQWFNSRGCLKHPWKNQMVFTKMRSFTTKSQFPNHQIKAKAQKVARTKLAPLLTLPCLRPVFYRRFQVKFGQLFFSRYHFGSPFRVSCKALFIPTPILNLDSYSFKASFRLKTLSAVLWHAWLCGTGFPTHRFTRGMAVLFLSYWTQLLLEYIY